MRCRHSRQGLRVNYKSQAWPSLSHLGHINTLLHSHEPEHAENHKAGVNAGSAIDDGNNKGIPEKQKIECQICVFLDLVCVIWRFICLILVTIFLTLNLLCHSFFSVSLFLNVFLFSFLHIYFFLLSLLFFLFILFIFLNVIFIFASTHVFHFTSLLSQSFVLNFLLPPLLFSLFT